MKILILILVFIFIISSFVYGSLVEHVVFDVNNTLIQSNQSYDLSGKELLEKVTDHTSGRSFYLRNGVRETLEYLIEKNIKISVLSFGSQHDVDDVLNAIKVNGKSMSEFVHVAFGSGVQSDYSRLKGSFTPKKDLSLVTHPDARLIYEDAKDFGRYLGHLRVNENPVGYNIIMVDDTPRKVAVELQDRTIKVNVIRERYSRSNFRESSEAFEVLEKLLEAEDRQFVKIRELIESSLTNQRLNNYNEWSKFISLPEELRALKSFTRMRRSRVEEVGFAADKTRAHKRDMSVNVDYKGMVKGCISALRLFILGK